MGVSATGANGGHENKAAFVGLAVCGALVVGTVAMGVILGMNRGQAPVGDVARAFSRSGPSAFSEAELIEFFEANYGEIWNTLSAEQKLNFVQIFEGKAQGIDPQLFGSFVETPEGGINWMEIDEATSETVMGLYDAQWRIDTLEARMKLRALAPEGASEWSVGQWQEWLADVEMDPLAARYQLEIWALMVEGRGMPSVGELAEKLDLARKELAELKNGVDLSLWEAVQVDRQAFRRSELLDQMWWIAEQAGLKARAVAGVVF